MNVTWCRSMRSRASSGSHRAMSTAFMPAAPATVTAFWSPEMCASGAGMSTVSAGPRSCTAVISTAFEARVPCVWRTPLGSPLDPDVCRTTARSSARATGASTRSPCSIRVATVSGATTSAGSSRSSSPASSVAPARWCSGAAIAPRRQHARNNTTASQQLGACPRDRVTVTHASRRRVLRSGAPHGPRQPPVRERRRRPPRPARLRRRRHRGWARRSGVRDGARSASVASLRGC